MAVHKFMPGKGSRNRVRDRKQFAQNHEEIDWSKRSSKPPEPKRVHGKLRYTYK